jgi:hypothetical protein
MTHPLLTGLDKLSDEEIHAKLFDLTQKYYATVNPGVQNQMMIIIDDLQYELSVRIAKRQQERSEEQQELDKLINIS